MTLRWNALVLAAGRGPGDPMAKAHGVTHKCAIPVGGIPMLRRVLDALAAHPAIGDIAVSMETRAVFDSLVERPTRRVQFSPSAESAPASALAAIAAGHAKFPLLITTGDHALLDGAMFSALIEGAEAARADIAVGLATAETILGRYPESRRTFLNFGGDRVSGCNLFALRTEAALAALDRWRSLDRVRKRPWRLVKAFGPMALFRYLTGGLTLDGAFGIASTVLGIAAVPVLLPFAEAAIDIDKPEDWDLAERILADREKRD